jgi:uncharacterized membrane protein
MFIHQLWSLDMLFHQVSDIIASQETRKDVMIGEKINDASEEKTVEQEHLTYANKLVRSTLAIVQSVIVALLGFNIIIFLFFNSLQYFRRLKMPLKRFWSLQILGLTGLGIR